MSASQVPRIQLASLLQLQFVDGLVACPIESVKAAPFYISSRLPWRCQTNPHKTPAKEQVSTKKVSAHNLIAHQPRPRQLGKPSHPSPARCLVAATKYTLKLSAADRGQSSDQSRRPLFVTAPRNTRSISRNRRNHNVNPLERPACMPLCTRAHTHNAALNYGIGAREGGMYTK